MAARHGIFNTEVDTSLSTVNTATSGIPFVIGVAPLASVDAADRATPNVPVLATSYAEAEKHLGYSDNWIDYGICEVMKYHFAYSQCQPVIFLPLTETILNQSFNGDGTVKEFTVTAKPKTVQKVEVSGTAVEITAYDASTGKVTLKNAPASGNGNVIAYYLSAPAAATVAAACEYIDLCMPMFSIIPDVILAPGFSDQSVVAAAMAAKIASVNGLFKGKSVVDIEADSYTAAVTAKNGGSYTEDMIAVWPCGGLGDYIFHGSTMLAGRMASTDTDNSGIPYESPSNKNVSIDRLCTSDGTEVVLTLAQANILNAAGICTFLNFMTGWKAWGNYTACFPGDQDVKNYFIPISRMFDWVSNTLIKTFWYKLDDPLNRRLIDCIVDSANIWLNGLTARGYLLGARVEMIEAENPLTDLMAGIIRLHVYMTPPSPAQEVDFILEYDVNYVSSLMSA